MRYTGTVFAKNTPMLESERGGEVFREKFDIVLVPLIFVVMLTFEAELQLFFVDNQSVIFFP